MSRLITSLREILIGKCYNLPTIVIPLL